ncbi:MAG: hypothetical protein SFY81_05600, partial [Verrucomicrobiota bacterium]|nr:hypothetical protein [Verrucomicrobiota bacterium]
MPLLEAEKTGWAEALKEMPPGKNFLMTFKDTRCPEFLQAAQLLHLRREDLLLQRTDRVSARF